MVVPETLGVLAPALLGQRTPPLMVKAPVPKAFVPPIITVPALSVKPPGYAFPWAPIFQTPPPLLMNPVPATVETFCPFQVKVEPVPISKVLIPAPVLNAEAA